MTDEERKKPEMSSSEDDPKAVPFEEEQAIDAELHDSRSDVRAVAAWKPEDAANFLARAIQESQKPLNDALKQRGVPVGVAILGLVIALLFVAGLFHLILRYEDRVNRYEHRIETGEKMQSDSLAAREEARNLEAALAAAKADRDKARARAEELDAQLDKAMGQINDLSRKLESQDTMGARVAELERLSRNAIETARKRKQAVALLQEQIAAQQREAEALKAQLAAARKLALVLQDEDGGAEDEAAPAEEAQTDAEADAPAPGGEDEAADEENPPVPEADQGEAKGDAAVPRPAGEELPLPEEQAEAM